MNRRIDASAMALSLLACLTVSGCGGTTTGNPTVDASASEIAESSLSGAANSTEPNGTQAFYLRAPARSLAAEFLDEISPVRASFASMLCPTIKSPTSCTSGAFLMTYSGCIYAGSLTEWNGSQNLDLSGGSCTITLPALNGKTLTRNFGTGTTETTVLKIKTIVDTTTAQKSGWDSSVTVGEGEQAVFTGTDGSRTLTLLGLHLHATTEGGTVLFDHTVSSTGTEVNGAGLGRVVSSGTITVQHNLAKYTAQAQITTPLTYNVVSCCHPGAGVITTTFTGSQSGTETLTFTGGTSGSCGTATLVTNPGTASSTSSDVTLSHCF